MYKVLCDGVPIYDPRHEELVLIDPKLTLELNTAGSFACKIPPGHPQYDKPQEITSRITVYQDDTILFQGRITSVSLDFYNRKTITCEGELAYLNDTIQRPAEYHDMTIRQYLEKIIELHNAQVDESRQFTVGIVTVTNSTDNVYRYTNWETSMQTIKEDLVDDLGGYVRVRYENGKRYIDYITDYGVISKQVIAFGENLLDFTRNVDLTDIATVCIPLGARQSESPIKALEARLTISSINDNKDYVESADAVKRYGRIVKTVTWDDVTTPERLKTHGEKWLEDEQFDAMTLECKAIDLHYVDSSQEALHLGDSVRIVSKPHGLDKYFPVTKLTISLNQLQNNTITFNGQIEQKRTLTARTGSTSEKLKNLIEVTPNKNEMVSEAIAEATALITAHTHGYITTSDDSSELLISDTTDYRNATNIWRWNLNGLGHSSTGYSGTYTTALTMDGWIVGSRVAAGSIGASQLSIDYKNTVTEEITEKSDAAKSAATSYTDTQLDTYKSEVSKAIRASEDRATKVANSATDLANAAQKTADGKITTYYQTAAPSSGMVTGDLWIDTDDGNKLYRYDGTSWTAIQDKAISDAMTAAGTAQATADGKVVTYAQTTAPSSTGLTVGDLWIDTDDKNHMYRWNGSKWAEVRDGYIEEARDAAESYTDTKLKNYYTKSEVETSISNTKDAVLISAKKTSTQYTDDQLASQKQELQSAIDNATTVANSATALAKAAQSTANKKIVTYYQASAPSSGMSTGDLWIDTDDGNKLYRYDGTSWTTVQDKAISEAMAAANTAQATADGKIITYYQATAPTSGMVVGDLWIDSDDGNKMYRYSGSTWVAVQDKAISTATTLAKAAQTAANAKITTWYQASAPSSGISKGDLWIDTDDGNKLYRYSGTEWTAIQDAAISKAMTAAGTAQATADGKVVTFAQASAPSSTGLTIGDLWIDTDDNNHMYRWDGKQWAEVRDGYIDEAKSTAEAYTDAKASALQTAIDNAQKVADAATSLANVAQTTANAKITTYYQIGAPTSGMSVGDLWVDQGADNLLRRWNGSEWASVADKNISTALLNAADAQATADGKITTYAQAAAPTSDMSVGDLWIDTDDGNKLYRYDGTSWVTVQDAAISAAQSLAESAKTLATSKITTYYQTAAPTADMSTGDLWIDTDDGNKLYRYSGSAWTAIQDTAISKAMTAAGTAQATADGKVVTYAQTSAPPSTGLTIGDLWIDTDDSNHMYRWDGTKWAEIRDGYIEEAKNAAESYTDTKLKEYSTSAEIKVMTDSISAEVAKKTDSATIISTINQSAEAVSINASKIALEGLVTANKNFQIDTDGNMTAVNGKFSGIITGATMQVADSSGTSQTAITSDGKIKSVDSNKTFWLNMKNGAFELGPIKSIGTNNQDLLISRMLNVEYGIEIWRQNENGEPYIDFHCEADSPSAASKYDYAARLSCQKAGYFQMLGVDKGDGNGHVHARLEVGGLELYTSKSSASSTTAGIPYIDFHLEDTAADYSMRIAAENKNSCVIRSEGGYAAIINTKAATISSASSKRVKRNIENITDADAEKLLDLRPVSFEYVYAPGETYHGLIAEEVQKVLPELVVIPKDYNPDDDTDMLHIPRLCYTDFIPYLIRLCQIQQKEIDALKGETA